MLPDRANESTRGGRPSRSMCSHKHRALLLPYALTGCSEADGISFEAHLLDCDACFDGLKGLDRAAALIGDPEVARLTLADLFYNAPEVEGVRAIPYSAPESDENHESKSA